jgi:uncharacterized protein
MFFQSGGCCDGTSPICLKKGELPAGPHDVRLGHIGGAPFYIDSDQYERWGTPRFLIDVSSGAAEGFSLEGLGWPRVSTFWGMPLPQRSVLTVNLEVGSSAQDRVGQLRMP